MAVFSFSIKDSKNKELKEMVELKKYCEVNGISFSHVVTEAVIKFVKNGGLDG